MAVDLQSAAIDPPSGADYTFLQGDIFSSEISAALQELGPYDLVLSDAAPRTSGSALVDAESSLQIADRVLEIACSTLKQGGHLVVKVFQGGEEGRLLHRMKTLFRRARAFKPESSRSQSRETYFLGLFFAHKS